MHYFIIDSLAPFFSVCPPTAEQNWSKLPFEALESHGRLDAYRCALVTESFSRYCAKVSALGFTHITLDDVAHLAELELYPANVKAKINDYRDWYRRLIAIAASHGLKVLLNTDFFFSNETIERLIGLRPSRLMRLCHRIFKDVFRSFNEIEGIIIRIGEADGVDVQGDFVSDLRIRTPRQCRRFLRTILPLFERLDRTLVFRTWTLGAYPIGDLMWNRDTWESAFSGVYSNNLLISCKYGEADFLKYLAFNPLLLETPQRKILELQTRREYEGFGEFPNFVGYDYERYRQYLDSCQSIAGIMVWCQTGGWSHFTRLTFCRDSSVWNEINTFVTISMFRFRHSAEESIALYARNFLSLENPKPLVSLLRIADYVIRELWYLPEFSGKRVYFRRIRVPPLLWVFWDTILINHLLRKVLRRFVHERIEAIKDGYRALHRLRQMRQYAEQCGIGMADIDFMIDTFTILAGAREYFFGNWDPAQAQRLLTMANEYKSKYPHGFHIEIDFSPTRLRKYLIKFLFRISLRTHPAYRWVDRMFLIRISSLIYPIINLWQKRRLPKFAREQTMGVQTFFK